MYVDDFPMFSLLELAGKYVETFEYFISITIENSPENYANELLLSFNRFSSVSCIGAFLSKKHRLELRELYCSIYP